MKGCCLPLVRGHEMEQRRDQCDKNLENERDHGEGEEQKATWPVSDED